MKNKYEIRWEEINEEGERWVKEEKEGLWKEK